MEHEVFVPVEEERLREVLDDPARVARAVPGLQHDAGADPVAGRLKVRVGSHSVTYRGSVRVSARDDGSYAVEGDAAEARGSGGVKLALRLRLRPTDTGTTVREAAPGYGAHATFAESHEVDRHTGVVWAMDLTALMHDGSRDPLGLVDEALSAFRRDVIERLRRLA